MSDTMVGDVLTGNPERDAIHIAVAPVIAHERLYPGMHIGLLYNNPDDQNTVASQAVEKKIGIVDPFLSRYVEPGEKFWMFLYPYTITGLKHVWTHPVFDKATEPLKTMKSGTARVSTKDEKEKKEDPDEDPVAKSKKWIEDWATSHMIFYEELMRNAAACAHDTSGWFFWSEGGRFEGYYLPEEFWHHYEIVKGTKVPEENKRSFFSCSC